MTEKGIQQAKEVANRLKDEKIDAAFVSTMTRAKQTAEEILKFHPDAEVNYSDDIKEMSFGDLEGKPTELLKEAWHGGIENFEGDYDDFRVGGGESFNDVIKRVKRALEEIYKFKDKTVIVVIHGRVIRVFVSILLNIPIKEVMKTRFLNTSITSFDIDENKCIKQDYNCVKHLESV